MVRYFTLALVLIALCANHAIAQGDALPLAVVARSADLVSADAMSKAALRVRDKQMPRTDAVDIFGAFFNVKTRRDNLIQCLDKYVFALYMRGDSFDRLNASVGVVEAARQLSAALAPMLRLTQSYGLFDQKALDAMGAYIRAQGGQLVHQLQIEQGTWVALSPDDATRLADQLKEDNERFQAGYKALGSAIVTIFGPDAIKEAAQKSSQQ